MDRNQGEEARLKLTRGVIQEALAEYPDPLDVAQAATIANYKPKTIRRLVSEGVIEAIRPGTAGGQRPPIRISHAALLAWLFPDEPEA